MMTRSIEKHQDGPWGLSDCDSARSTTLQRTGGMQHSDDENQSHVESPAAKEPMIPSANTSQKTKNDILFTAKFS